MEKKILNNDNTFYTMKAIWNKVVIAESNNTIVIERNHYFPQESVNFEFLKNSDTQTSCPWKGVASYYSIEANGQISKDAAWHYPTPLKEAKQIKNHIAFWRGVELIE